MEPVPVPNPGKEERDDGVVQIRPPKKNKTTEINCYAVDTNGFSPLG